MVVILMMKTPDLQARFPPFSLSKRAPSVRAAVQRACPFMPTSLGEWADLDTDRLSSLSSSSLPPAVSAAGRRQRPTASFDDTEALALRALWEVKTKGLKRVVI